ncbi:hypothetical protein [Paenibacillus apiarius]|uniref:Phage minor structural protein n=1 Tax=Paenibacillus apiarius TaxID=46240 RepID=A0ABT4DQQ9_9BACL|nr:hypothetical protein [Paenibacillus apiarius]MCY9513321.1 hypothetical protein [Paenibacillus apiarius]MCY9519707.1 hypothetical protein [Paenibacillus apiarius]MCY9553237.1 hypothetical protein [Paenibacillus apiarius]MCY9557087.1 hypothetical protein [Paenibacillus apiarius]MCY9682172.1 hypothetical protein [Paenibacillus apiarius]
MIEVSQEYKQAVYAPTRRTAAKVSFEILDNEAYDDNTSSVTSEAEISRKDQLTNKAREMSHRYATFERDYFRLDGSYHIPPRSGEDDSELGWWSDVIADENSVFSPPQVVTWTFAEEHNSMGLTMHFDVMANEYAADFDIDVYRLDGGRVAHESVVGNASTTYVWVHGLDNYGKIVLTIRKWAKPNRRARITEIDFGVIKEYEGDKLIKVSLVEQMNVVGDTLPANELKFTIDNSNKEFNILNPQGFYRFLKERQEVSLSIGVEVAEDEFEYINFEKYYLTDWQSDEGALTTTMTARNIFELLEQREYTQSAAGTLYTLAKDILLQAGVERFFIDEGLRDIPTNGFTDKMKARKALQCIGIAGKCAVYQDRQGVLNIRRFEVLDAQTTYMVYAGTDIFAGEMTYPAVDNGYDMKNITFDNVYKEPQIKLDKLVQFLVMTIYADGQKQELTFYNEGIKEGAALKCDNPLIQSQELAADVAEWIIGESNLRALYTVNWRQNPCLEPGDIVLVEDSFEAKKQSRITKHEFQFSGYLSGKTETKGGV